ncbi:MAG: sigma-70 family RNA polymerase sigma factor [Chloroflexota bacterium]|nr:sigma-70 family RNA polymerase sigma factor [Chloroflexota bacterium]
MRSPKTQPAALAPPGTGPDASAEDDAALVARAQEDRGAFGPLYDRYADRVYRYCLRRLGTREAAEDATSQTFTEALAGLAGFRGGSFAAWLFAIAHNVCANAGRRHPNLPLDAAGDPPDSAPHAAPEARALADEATRELRALLDVLPPDQRRVAELRLAGLTGAEIAAAMGRSLAAVKMLQVRALARLRAAHVVTERAGEPR